MIKYEIKLFYLIKKMSEVKKLKIVNINFKILAENKNLQFLNYIIEDKMYMTDFLFLYHLLKLQMVCFFYLHNPSVFPS